MTDSEMQLLTDSEFALAQLERLEGCGKVLEETHEVTQEARRSTRKARGPWLKRILGAKSA